MHIEGELLRVEIRLLGWLPYSELLRRFSGVCYLTGVKSFIVARYILYRDEFGVAVVSLVFRIIHDDFTPKSPEDLVRTGVYVKYTRQVCIFPFLDYGSIGCLEEICGRYDV